MDFFDFVFQSCLNDATEAGASAQPVVWKIAISDSCLVLKFGVAAGKDKRNIAFFVQKSKISLAKEHTSTIDVNDCANNMVCKI